MSPSFPHVELSIDPDGSVTVRTSAKVTVESPVGATAAPATVQRPPDVARRLARLEAYDPATLAAQTYDSMVELGYKAGPIKQTSNAPYIRMVYVSAGKSSTLYMDSKGLYSANSEQAEFARGLAEAQPGARYMVRYPFALGQKAINRIAQAFKDRLDQYA